MITIVQTAFTMCSSEIIFFTFLVMVFSFAQVGLAEAKWLVRTKDSPSKVQFTLFEDGSIQRANRGDPKTDYDQRENCQHGKSKNCKKETEYAFDLTNWNICAQGGSNHTDNFFVNFGNGGCGFGYDYHVGVENAFVRALVYYDLNAGGVPIKVYQISSYQIQTEAEIEGFGTVEVQVLEIVLQ